MKFAFFGTPEFAAIILERIIAAGFVPSAVICNPDRPVGRKKVITAPPVKTRIMNDELRIKNAIKILQPEKLDEEFLNSLFQINNSFDFFIVAAYSKIIPKSILEIPKLGTIGVHPSLLPKYRGASPIQSAILAGENETGVTLFLMDEKIDHGQILAKRELTMTNDDDYDNLQKKLAELGADLLIQTLPKFLAGEIKPMPQNENEATYTKKFKTEDGFVNLDKDSPVLIERKIRALNPEPGVWIIQNNKRVKILRAELADGKLKFKKIQVEGKKPENL